MQSDSQMIRRQVAHKSKKFDGKGLTDVIGKQKPMMDDLESCVGRRMIGTEGVLPIKKWSQTKAKSENEW